MHGKFDGLGRFAEQLSTMQRIVRVGRRRTSTAWGT